MHLPAVCVRLLRDLTLRCHRVPNRAQAHSGVKAISPCLPQTALAGSRTQPPVSAVHLSYYLALDTRKPSASCHQEAPRRPVQLI